jgi:hypothetical protein
MTMAFAISIALAQNPSASTPPLKSVIGTVESVSGKVIYVQTGLQVLTLTATDRTEVWKGKVFHDLSPVAVGDDITARCRMDVAGKLVAETVWLNIVNLFAVITKTGDNEFEMFANPNTDPQSAYKKEFKLVAIDADTIFEASAREDLKQGRNVQVMGSDLKNGTIHATRVTVYEGNRPVRMGNGRIILSNGQIR